MPLWTEPKDVPDAKRLYGKKLNVFIALHKFINIDAYEWRHNMVRLTFTNKGWMDVSYAMLEWYDGAQKVIS